MRLLSGKRRSPYSDQFLAVVSHDTTPFQYSTNLLVVLLVCLVLQTCSARAEVIALTTDTFSDKSMAPDTRDSTEKGGKIRIEFKRDTAWFIKFCIPWCKHCKNLGALWEDLGKEMEGEDEIEIGEVDCGTDKPVCAKVDIHSYPTYKLFYNGEEVVKYQGARNVESLKNFALEETEKAAIKSQLDNGGEL